MPLSEDEQRILQEIEQQFYEHDPDLAREVSSTTVYRHAGRNLKWATLGFLIMLASAFVFERNLRRMGRAGWQQMTESMRAGNLREYFGDAGNRIRRRFRHDE